MEQKLFKVKLNPANDHNTRDTRFIFSIKTLYFRRRALHKKETTREFHSYIFPSIVFYLSLSNLCLFGCFFIFCFKVILDNNFSFPRQPIDWNLKETQNIDLNLQFRFRGRSSTCEVNTANGIYFCNYLKNSPGYGTIFLENINPKWNKFMTWQTAKYKIDP